jgi:threonine dehydrogenase-like Zn-dependent dehydrogenase
MRRPVHCSICSRQLKPFASTGVSAGVARMREQTDGLGVDVLVDCSARAAAASVTAGALNGLKRGGAAINIGALSQPLPIQPMRFMTGRIALRGSNWFTTGEGQLMAEMAGSGGLGLSHLEPRPYPLAGVNDALEANALNSSRASSTRPQATPHLPTRSPPPDATPRRT